MASEEKVESGRPTSRISELKAEYAEKRASEPSQPSIEPTVDITVGGSANKPPTRMTARL